MRLVASDFAGRPRESKWESDLATELQKADEDERLEFLWDLLSVHLIVALNLARITMTKASSFEAILERGLKNADASNIRWYIACVSPRLGLRRVMRLLRRHATKYPYGVRRAVYWLPLFLEGSGYSMADIRDFQTDVGAR